MKANYNTAVCIAHKLCKGAVRPWKVVRHLPLCTDSVTMTAVSQRLMQGHHRLALVHE